MRTGETALAVAADAAVGLVVLGIAGRLLMSALVLAAGGRPAFSLGGSIKVAMVGTVYGALGGLLLLPLRRLLATRKTLSGLFLASRRWPLSLWDRDGRSLDPLVASLVTHGRFRPISA